MDASALYGFTLTLVLVGMIIGIGVLVLDKLASSTSITSAANTSILASRDAVGSIATDWMSLKLVSVA